MLGRHTLVCILLLVGCKEEPAGKVTLACGGLQDAVFLVDDATNPPSASCAVEVESSGDVSYAISGTDALTDLAVQTEGEEVRVVGRCLHEAEDQKVDVTATLKDSKTKETVRCDVACVAPVEMACPQIEGGVGVEVVVPLETSLVGGNPPYTVMVAGTNTLADVREGDTGPELALTCIDIGDDSVSFEPGDTPATCYEGTYTQQDCAVRCTGCDTLLLDGDYVAITDDPILDLGTDPFTVEFWVSLATAPRGKGYTLVAHDTGGSAEAKWAVQYGPTTDSPEAPVVWFLLDDDTSNGPWKLFGQQGSLTVGQWNHVAVTRQGADYTLFIDGVEVGSDTHAPLLQGSWGPLTIGWGETPGGGYTDGRFSHVHLSRTVRYSGGFPLDAVQTDPDSATIGLWRLDEGVGTDTIDASANQLDGVHVGDPTWTVFGCPPGVPSARR